MQAGFTITTPTAIRFGVGCARDLASELPAGAVLLVRGGSPRTSQPVRTELDRAGRRVHQATVVGEPSVASVNSAFATTKDLQIGVIVACGGGSVLDTAKALRLCLEAGAPLPDDISKVEASALAGANRLPLIAIPTTAGTGAEVTSNAVLGTATSKMSIRGRALYADIALVDPDLMKHAPKEVVLGAGLDAVTQTIEAYTSRLASPFTDALTLQNIALGPQALRRIVEDDDAAAWSDIAWVSLSSGLALANGGLGAAHGLAAVLGARLGAPHGMLCGRLLGPVLLKNRDVAPPGSDAHRRIETCLTALTTTFPPIGGEGRLSGFFHWLDQHNVPRLRDFSLNTQSFGPIAEAAVSASSSQKNAVPLRISDLWDILDVAY